MKVSFIIPVYNQLELTRACLESLQATVPELEKHEIIVVDDGSDAATREGLQTLVVALRGRLIEYGCNRGYAYANNRGAFEAQGDLLLLLNNDLILLPGWFQPLVDAFERLPDAGLVGNVQLDAKTGEIDHAGFYADAKATLRHRRKANRRFGFTSAYTRFKMVTAACCAIRRTDYLAAGGFDEAFVNGCEDVDLCFRLARLGRRCYVANRSVVKHHVSATRAENDVNQERNFRLLQRRWRPLLAQHAALKWPDEYIASARTQPRLFRWSFVKQAVPRWLGFTKGPAPLALRVADCHLDRKERHWRALLDGWTDEDIKRHESARHAQWLTGNFGYEQLFPDPAGGEGLWIRETASIRIPKGLNVSDFDIVGAVAPAAHGVASERGCLGLRLTVNQAEAIVRYPLEEGSFTVRFENPPISASHQTLIELELIGVGKSNALAYLGRKLEGFALLPSRFRRWLASYRPQRLNRRLTLLRLDINGENVLDFARPASPLNFGYALRHGSIGINLVGWFKAELGIGESARLSAKALKASSIDHCLVPLKVNCLAAQGDQSYDGLTSEANPYPINVFHIDAPQCGDIDHHHGASFRQDRYNIAYWAWELPEFPDDWIRYFRYFHEIWTPSNFVRDAIAMKSPLPVVTMPHCIEVNLPKRNYRQLLGLPEDKFLFCFAYDLNSYQERKNPKAIIKAFKEAFAGTDRESDVRLVIKTHSVANNQAAYQELLRELAGIQNYQLIDTTLSRDMMYGLMQACDCYVSLHRSEGFGLTVAESMALGKPVISTNWSATAEFLDAANGCPVQYQLVELERNHGPYQKGQVWAEPDINSAAQHMQRLVNDSDLAFRLGSHAKATISTRFSPRRIGERYEQRLKSIALWQSPG